MIKKVLFVCSLGNETGLGHFARCKMLMEHFNKKKIKYDLIKLEDEKKKDYAVYIYKKAQYLKPNVIIFDLNKKFLNLKFLKVIRKLKKERNTLIGIDNLRIFYKYLDLVWVPSFFIEKKYNKKNIVYGWDKFLLKKYNYSYKIKKNIYILTGASTNHVLPKYMPKMIEKNIPKNFNIIWVQGKYSIKPILNFKSNRWKVLKNPKSYFSYLSKAGYVLSLYGMSFYESISLGVPTVCFPYGINKHKDKNELKEIKKLNISIIEKNYKSAIDKLKMLIQNKKKSLLLSRKSKLRFKQNGLVNFEKYLTKFF